MVQAYIDRALDRNEPQPDNVDDPENAEAREDAVLANHDVEQRLVDVDEGRQGLDHQLRVRRREGRALLRPVSAAAMPAHTATYHEQRNGLGDVHHDLEKARGDHLHPSVSSAPACWWRGPYGDKGEGVDD